MKMKFENNNYCYLLFKNYVGCPKYWFETIQPIPYSGPIHY